MQKDEEKQTVARKRAREEDEKLQTKCSVDLSAAKDELQIKKCQLRAAQNIIESGRVKLAEAVAAVPLARQALVAAQSLIDIGAEKAMVIEATILELEKQNL